MIFIDQCSSIRQKLYLLTNNTNQFFMHISIKCGSTNDPKGLEGISHFLEHIKFGDTLKRKSILDEAESIGATMNAYTSFEETSYFIECSEEFYEKAIEIILTTVFLTNFSEFTEKNINDERKIILQEKSLRNDGGINKSFVGLMLEDDNKYTKPIIGTREGINNITKRDLNLYNETKYSLGNAFIIVNSSKKIQNKVINISDKWLKRKNIIKEDTGEQKSLLLNAKTAELSASPPKISHSLYVVHMNSKYNSANLYFKSFDMCNENFFTLKFVDYVVFKVLFRSLRKNKQLIYTVNCNSYGHKDIGVTNINFSSTHPVSDIINVIFAQLHENVIDISAKDYFKIKKNFINISKHSILKDPSHAVYFEKLNLFMKKRVHFEKYIEHITKLDRETFSKLCKHIMNRSNVSISATYNDHNDEYHIKNITQIIQSNSGLNK